MTILVVCPNKCKACTYSALTKKSTCTDAKCDTGYAKNVDTGTCNGKD